MKKKNKIENRKIRKEAKIYNLFAQKWRQCCALRRRRRRRRCMFVIECIVRAGGGGGCCAVLATLPTTNLMPAVTATAAAATATATATCQQQRLPPTWGTNSSGSKDDPREWRRGTCAWVSVCIFYALRLLPLPQPLLPQPVLPLWAVSEIICITFLPATNQRHEKLDGN